MAFSRLSASADSLKLSHVFHLALGSATESFVSYSGSLWRHTGPHLPATVWAPPVHVRTFQIFMARGGREDSCLCALEAEWNWRHCDLALCCHDVAAHAAVGSSAKLPPPREPAKKYRNFTMPSQFTVPQTIWKVLAFSSLVIEQRAGPHTNVSILIRNALILHYS